MGFFDEIKCVFGHNWSSWSYKLSNDCLQERKCIRSGCDAKETRTEHIYGDFKYENDKSCQQKAECIRCGHVKYGKKEHDWSPWITVIKSDKEKWQSSIRTLYNFTNESCELADIKLFCLKLGFDIENLKGKNKKELIISLIKKCSQYGLLAQFTTILSELDGFSKQKIEKIIKLKENLTENSDYIEHISFYEPENSSCTKERTCKRCSETQETTVHKFMPETYESDISCKLVQTCTICGETHYPNKPKKHIYGNWEFESPVSCQLVRKCERCGHGDSNKKDTVHEKLTDWYKPYQDSCETERKCERCGEIEEGNINHDWSMWLINNKSRKQYKHCSHCHEEIYDISGEWQGDFIWDNDEKNKCKLKVEQNRSWIGDQIIRGELIVQFPTSKGNALVKQIIKGYLNGNQLNFKSNEIIYLNDVAKSFNYNKDSFEGTVSAKAGSIIGEIYSKRMTGKAKFY